MRLLLKRSVCHCWAIADHNLWSEDLMGEYLVFFPSYPGVEGGWLFFFKKRACFSGQVAFAIQQDLGCIVLFSFSTSFRFCCYWAFWYCISASSSLVSEQSCFQFEKTRRWAWFLKEYLYGYLVSRIDLNKGCWLDFWENTWIGTLFFVSDLLLNCTLALMQWSITLTDDWQSRFLVLNISFFPF